MAFSVMALCAAFALLFQMVALPLYRVGLCAPDFLFLVVAYFALEAVPRRSVAFALACGLVLDLLSADPMGAHALGYAASAGLLSSFRKEGWSLMTPPRWLLVLVAVAAAWAVRALALAARGDPAFPRDFTMEIGFVVYEVLLSLPAFVLLDAVLGGRARSSSRPLG
jgi:rod shape-determining protein MreD